MWFFGKCRSNRLKKDFPIFVETFLLNGGLNHMIFLLCLLCVVDSLNIISVEDRFDRRVPIEIHAIRENEKEIAKII